MSRAAMALAMAGLIALEFAVLIWGYVQLVLTSIYTHALRLPDMEPFGADAIPLGFAYLYAIAPLAWFGFGGARPSKALYVYLWMAVLVPSTIFTMTSDGLDTWARHLGCAMSVAAFLVAYVAYMLPLRRFKPLANQRRLGWIMLASLTLLGTAYFAATNPRALASVQFLDVYEKRLELRDAIESGATGRLQVYLTNWMGIAIAPFLAAYGLVMKRPALIGASLVVALVSFAISTHKSVFFTTLIVMILAIALNRFGRRLPGAGGAAVGIGCVLVAMLATALLLDALFVGTAVFSWFTGFRMFSNNGFLSAIYFEFFRDEPPLLYADSFLRRIFTSEHDMSFSRRVGEFITWYDGANNANANFLADGYVNLGYAGMVFASAQLALVLWIMDCAAQGKNMVLAACTVLPAGLIFSNAPIHTGLLTNGVGICILLLLLVPREGGEVAGPVSAEPAGLGLAPRLYPRH